MNDSHYLQSMRQLEHYNRRQWFKHLSLTAALAVAAVALLTQLFR